MHRTFQFYIIEFGLEVEIVLLSSYIFLHNVIVAFCPLDIPPDMIHVLFPKLKVGIHVNSLKPESDLNCIYDLLLIHY